ncbi:MAG: peptide-methionine (S)-S-oxide reductase MsrA, partial [Candidatus Heimdallarchaeaceae archaeon]
ILSGYSGGQVANPSYEQVCAGNTGHAEVVHFTFSENLISFEELLDIFFAFHDPTTLNRQGNDVGSQYRSVIFFHTKKQQKIAKRKIVELTQNEKFRNPIVTEVLQFSSFYPAKEYHQDYYSENKNQAYCRLVIKPKVTKFKKDFVIYLKKGD